ncbi:hypothetical protein HYN56_15880 [Flavobacterium crocinum]|uniref:DUF4199 domain-containing protein n=1 Tax=Flavobacterium crocinum TaxID=2183896 RepID=A0A2S1YP93_9FLAO|nr:hypothetical protein [Flavobacterium crocinum]AWK05638.1 hypothetical protein HYN56_15880 [Flavobacterium crocinum]
MKKISITFMFMLSLAAFSQQLTYKNGRIFNSENKKLSNAEIKELLAPTPELLSEYKSGRSKASVGGFMLGLGLGFIVADLATGATQDKVYPSAFTYLGVASTLISIPVISGHSKKIKSAVDGYNESLQVKKTVFTIESINILTNQNGVGLCASF